MVRQRNEIHAKQVEAWKEKNAELSSSEMTLLYVKAIQAVYKRSLGTLSLVTVVAVVDRTLHECKEKYPLLSAVESDAEGLHFGKMLNQLQNSKPEDSQKVLHEFLIELLDIFGKITAEILTRYLHQELMTVTKASLRNETKLHAPQAPSLAKKIGSRNES